MKRIPEAFQSGQVNFRTEDVARCHCGGNLSFVNRGDFNGYMMEVCDKCKERRPMGRAQRSAEETVRAVKAFEWKIAGECPEEGCGKPMRWRGQGNKPKRCQECAAVREKLMSRDWNRERNRRKREEAA